MSNLRDILRANLFDGDESGEVTMPIAALLTDVVDIVRDHTLDLASPEAAEELARALGQAEVGCWANIPTHGSDEDDEVHARDAVAILAALLKERETLGS